MKVSYDAGPREVAIARTGQRAQRGEVVEVPDSVGRRLVAQGWKQHDAAGNELAGLTRSELNERAEELGINDPGSLPNKQAVIDAIAAAEAGDLEQEKED